MHVALLTSTRAKVEAVIEWAWDYFGGSRGDLILDRPEELQIDWNNDAEEMASAESAANKTTEAAGLEDLKEKASR